MDENVIPSIGEPEWRQDPAKVAAFEAWAGRTFPGGLRCPLCATVDPVIGNMVQSAAYPPSPAFPRGRNVVYLQVDCGNCWHAMLFNAEHIGLLGRF